MEVPLTMVGGSLLHMAFMNPFCGSNRTVFGVWSGENGVKPDHLCFQVWERGLERSVFSLKFKKFQNDFLSVQGYKSRYNLRQKQILMSICDQILCHPSGAPWGVGGRLLQSWRAYGTIQNIKIIMFEIIMRWFRRLQYIHQQTG